MDSPTVDVRSSGPAQEHNPSQQFHQALVLLGVSESRHPLSYRHAEPWRVHWELTIIVRGRQGLAVDGQEAEVGPVEAFLVAPGHQLEEWNTGDGELHRLRVLFSGMDCAEQWPLKVQDTAGRLHELCSWLVAESDAQFPEVEGYRVHLLRALLAEFRRLSVVAANRIEERTRTFMLKHLGQSITLDDLASNVGMSRYYFCRVYKDIAGHTPMEHLRALRLERAKDLIRSTALPLKAIAPEVGFGSAQHLCRLLHDRFGVGVRELRGNGAGAEIRARSI